MSGRASPFYCPYCSDEDLRPHGETHGAWECRSCLRAFKLSFIGQLNPSFSLHGGAEDSPTHGRRRTP